MVTTAPVIDKYRADQDTTLEVPRPFDFGFEFGDGQGMVQHRRESSDINGVVKGSYGYTNSNGLYRKVEYTAGADGYKAVIKSNEPGLSNQNSADATFLVEPPPPGAILQQIVPVPSAETVVTEM
ncbi:cuticle protein 16.8 [Nephila pilipes]|uniref:Cuticle protein 16.8 n=1 Tax=Nephila pilipes TaxID=299642 RepID=A0A8X6THW8_NEPPI|nr:cuticle protein 16.8 [Nephila pilipes]